MSASLNMSDVQSLIGDLQAEAVKPGASVTNLLRIAKIAATKLNSQDALVWIDRELKGYMDLKIEDLPPYRRLTGVPKGYNPYHGWQPIHFQDPETSRFFSEAPIGEALGAIEETIRGKSDGTYTFPYPPERKRRVQQALSHPADVHIELAYGQLWNIIDQVRNLILNWALELEKAGVIGKNMQFSESEKGHAGPVTQHFFIQNVGHSKYPPAEPGALGLEPLEAAGLCCINPHSYSHCGMPPQEPSVLLGHPYLTFGRPSICSRVA
jgi:hypothetical protein